MNDTEMSLAQCTEIIQELVDDGIAYVIETVPDDSLKTVYGITPFGSWLFQNRLELKWSHADRDTRAKIKRLYEEAQR